LQFIAKWGSLRLARNDEIPTLRFVKDLKASQDVEQLPPKRYFQKKTNRKNIPREKAVIKTAEFSRCLQIKSAETNLCEFKHGKNWESNSFSTIENPPAIIPKRKLLNKLAIKLITEYNNITIYMTNNTISTFHYYIYITSFCIVPWFKYVVLSFFSIPCCFWGLRFQVCCRIRAFSRCMVKVIQPLKVTKEGIS